MSCLVTSVFTFKIESTFDEWVAIFDSAEADKRHSEFDIKPLFRGVSKEDPQLKGEVLLVGAINRISKTIPVKARGNTQIPINL